MKERIINEDTILIDTVISAVDNIQNVLTKALEKVNPEGTKDVRERVFGHICSLTKTDLKNSRRQDLQVYLIAFVASSYNGIMLLFWGKKDQSV